MFKNYLKTTIRSLWKNKTYSFLNIFGLAIGIACAALIFLWVENEMGYDQFHVKKDRLFYVLEDQQYDGDMRTYSSTPGPLGPALLKEVPGIANTCRSTEDNPSLLFRIGEKTMYASGKFAEPSLFGMFTIPFVQGNAANAFSQLYSMVITEKTAIKFFGDTKNVIGKTVRVDNKQDYVISGVVKDMPANSTLQFEWVAPFQIYYDARAQYNKWGNNSMSTYVELRPGVDYKAMNKQLYNFVQLHEADAIAHIFLHSMNDWHLRGNFENGKQTGGQIAYVRMFSIIAWIILFIACINFMNLATARSEKRAREVGVRKVLGAAKQNLIVQFIGEALFMALMATVLAVVVMQLVLPAFNMLVQKQLTLGLTNPFHIGALLLITLICGFVAGSYPSLYLSSFNPVFVLKGLKIKTGSAGFVRKGLVIIQFTISIVLIISTIIIYQQIQHVKSRQLGFNKDRLIRASAQGDMAKHFEAVKEELLATGVVENAAITDHETIYGGNNTSGFTWPGKAPNSKILISIRYVSPEFMSTSKIKLVDGRDFRITDTGKVFNILITESLAKLMGKESAVGKTIGYEGDTLKATVVGVISDYVYGNMYGTPDPVLFVCSANSGNLVYMRLKPAANTEKAMAAIETVMKKNNPAYPFEYKFVDDQFNEMFMSEMLVSKLSRVFAALAILISCLGLFGLAAYTAERRTKEIGIRKVLGASVAAITGLLSKDFLQLIAISAITAFPLAWWAMHSWLQNYNYRITISWWIFLLAGLLAVSIALITISFQSIRAALMNPVKSLRSE